MSNILQKYNKLLEENKKIFTHVRVTIREDEEFGEAIVEMVDGTPHIMIFNKEEGRWE